MAYGDNVDPKNRVVAIVLVGLFTAVLGYGLVNGLNISIVQKIAEKLDVVDVEEPQPPEEPPPPPPQDNKLPPPRSEEHTSELQSLLRLSYAVLCLKKTNK